MSIYFDHAATTPISDSALIALTNQAKKLGNASSLHSAGRSVRKDLETAREEIAKAIDCAPSEVIFTATGTEANNLAIKGLYWKALKAGKNVIITSTFEHHAVMDPILWLGEHEGAKVIEIDVDRNGVVDLDKLNKAISENKDQIAFISIMHSNNEVGTVQDIAKVVQAAGDIPVHSDCVQSFGKVDLSFKELGLTAATISAHKIGGPLGVAALILKRGLDIEPILHGGGQERDIRSGTFNAPSILAFAAAAKESAAQIKERAAKVRNLKQHLIEVVKKNVADAWVNGDQTTSLPGIVSITFPRSDSEGLLLLLDSEGIACSTGSACSAGVQRPSHVLLAMGLSEDETTSTLRFSLSHSNTIAEIEKLGAVIASVVERSRAASGKKMKKLKVIAAMSGGVDSAVAAARAVDAGYEVVGVHLALSSNPQKYRSGARGCCTIEDSHDARRAADVIGIPFYIWDMAEEFHKGVVENFLSEYQSGRTPNPCLRCNEKIKFEAVLDRAKALGFDGVVTGHYAITKDSPTGKTLHRAADIDKDQSYVLAVLRTDQIEGAIFPLGDTVKTDTRKEAKERGLFVANKPDSHDICFVPSGDNAGWLRERLGSETGDIVDQSGKKLGEHKGAYTYTIGQRRGLALTVPDPTGEPRYVLKIEPKSNTVVVGSHDALAVSTISATPPTWCGPVPEVNKVLRGFAQVRAHGAALACDYKFDGTNLIANLDEPVFGLATGQALVIYDNDRVVGSGTICETI